MLGSTQPARALLLEISQLADTNHGILPMNEDFGIATSGDRARIRGSALD